MQDLGHMSTVGPFETSSQTRISPTPPELMLPRSHQSRLCRRRQDDTATALALLAARCCGTWTSAGGGETLSPAFRHRHSLGNEMEGVSTTGPLASMPHTQGWCALEILGKNPTGDLLSLMHEMAWLRHF